MPTFAALEDLNYLGLNLVDWVVLVIYFIVIMGIGIWSYKKVKDMSDFFMGGRRFGKIFMMFFAFGAGTSSEQAVTVVAGTWRHGLVGIWWQLLWIFATPFYWIVAPVMRRMRALTTADFFESRFDTSTATLYSVYGIIISIVFLAALLFASGKMVNALTGGELDRLSRVVDWQVPAVSWDSDEKAFVQSTRRVEGYEYAVLAMTFMFVIYGMAGGLGAAILTDFIQGILTIVFSFLLLPYVFYMIGGFGMLNELGPDIKPGVLDIFADAQAAASMGKEPLTVFYVFMLSVTALAGIVVQPHIMGVCGAGKTEMEGRFGFTFGNFLKRFCTMAWTFTGLACIVWYLGDNSPLKHEDAPPIGSAEFKQLDVEEQARIKRDRETYAAAKMRVSPEFDKLPEAEQKRIDDLDKKFSDQLFGRAAYDILPIGLVGLLLASLLAAMMSSGDAQMVVSSGLFTDNIYRRFLVRNASERHYLWAGRISGLVIVAIALFLQSTFYDVIDAIKVVLKTPAAIGISLWIGIIWRGWTPIAVWISTICAASAWWFVAYRADLCHEWFGNQLGYMFAGPERMYDSWQMVCYISAGVISGLVVSLMTPRPSKEKLDHFFTLLHTPVTSGEKVEKPCTLPDDHRPREEKLFNLEDIEVPKPTWVGFGGFVAAWVLVGIIIWLTQYLAQVW